MGESLGPRLRHTKYFRTPQRFCARFTFCPLHQLRHNGLQSHGVPNSGGGYQPSHQPSAAAAATTIVPFVALALVLALVLILDSRSLHRLLGGNLPLRNGRTVPNGLCPCSRRRRGLRAVSPVGAAQEGEEEEGLAHGQERLWKEQHEKYHLLKLSCRRHQAPVRTPHSILTVPLASFSPPQSLRSLFFISSAIKVHDSHSFLTWTVVCFAFVSRFLSRLHVVPLTCDEVTADQTTRTAARRSTSICRT